jgi:hypothetical protein
LALTRGIKGYFELADGRDFIVNDKNVLLQKFSGTADKVIIGLPRSSLGYWAIQQHLLYFVEVKGPAAYINRLDLLTGDKEQKLFFKNERIASFSLHPQGHKMLITKSLSDNGDLVKVQLK